MLTLLIKLVLLVIKYENPLKKHPLILSVDLRLNKLYDIV